MSKQSGVSRALKLVRQFHRLSQTEVADRIGVSKSYLSELESGKKAPTVELLQNYSNEFDLPASSLLLIAERLEGKGSPDQHKKVDRVLRFLELIGDDE
jgi:transcriptional regulator with XRE-family HTH domain